MNKFKDILKMNTKTVFNNKMEDVMKNTFKLTLLLSALVIPGAMVAMDPSDQKPGKPVPSMFFSRFKRKPKSILQTPKAQGAFKQLLKTSEYQNILTKLAKVKPSKNTDVGATLKAANYKPGLATGAVFGSDRSSAARDLGVEENKSRYSMAQVILSNEKLSRMARKARKGDSFLGQAVDKACKALQNLQQQYGFNLQDKIDARTSAGLPATSAKLDSMDLGAIAVYESVASLFLKAQLQTNKNIADFTAKQLAETINGFRALHGEAPLYLGTGAKAYVLHSYYHQDGANLGDNGDNIKS